MSNWLGVTSYTLVCIMTINCNFRFPRKESNKHISIIGVWAGRPPSLLKVLEYYIIQETNLQQFSQKELHNMARLIKNVK